jgi:hypothetical protein
VSRSCVNGAVPDITSAYHKTMLFSLVWTSGLLPCLSTCTICLLSCPSAIHSPHSNQRELLKTQVRSCHITFETLQCLPNAFDLFLLFFFWDSVSKNLGWPLNITNNLSEVSLFWFLIYSQIEAAWGQESGWKSCHLAQCMIYSWCSIAWVNEWLSRIQSWDAFP